MKNALFLLFFALLPALACSQSTSPFPNNFNKARLGYATSGAGLVHTTDSLPDYTPVDRNAPVLHMDSTAGILYFWKGGVWNATAGADGNGMFSVGNNGDTVRINIAVVPNGPGFALRDVTSDVVFAINDNSVTATAGDASMQAVKSLGYLLLQGDSLVIQINGSTGLPGQVIIATGDGGAFWGDPTGATEANNGVSMSGDTVQLGGILTKNTEVDINGKTLRFRDAAGYPDLFMNGTYGLFGSDANTYLDVGSTAGRARIVASTTAQLTSAANTDVSATDTVTIVGQRIRLSAADTRIQQVTKDNALNRVMMLDSLTNKVYYRDVSSIAGGGGSISDGDKGDVVVSSSGATWTLDVKARHKNLDWLDWLQERDAAAPDSILYQYKNSDTITILAPFSDTKAVQYRVQKRDDFRKLFNIDIVEPELYTNKDSVQGTWSGTTLYSGTLGSKVFLTFTGTGAEINYYKSSSRGKIKFWLVGETDTVEVDGYNATEVSYARSVIFSGLTYGTYTMIGEVTTPNPSSSGSSFSMWQYVSSGVLRDNYSFIVKTLTDPTYTYVTDAIMDEASNSEFAFSGRPLSCSGCASDWIPYHGTNTALLSGDSLKFLVDGAAGVAVPGIAAPFRSAKKAILTQEILGYHVDSVGISGRELANIKTVHSFEGNELGVSVKTKWLRQTIVTGYSYMLGFANAFADSLFSDQGQKMAMNATDDSEENFTTTYGVVNSYVVNDAAKSYAVASKIKTDFAHNLTSLNRRNPPMYLQHRSSGPQKVYLNVYNGDTTDVGEELNSEYSIKVAPLTAQTKTRTVTASTGADGSETIVTAGTNITVTGTGTTAAPYVINSTATGISGLTTGTIPKAASATSLENSIITEASGAVDVGGTVGLRVPNGTDAQRAGSPPVGQLRFSTTSDAPEIRGATEWQSFVRSSTPSGKFTNQYILFANSSGLATTNATFRFAGTSTGLVVGGIQINGGGTSVSETGQGFASAAASRTLWYLASGSNATAGDASAFVHRIGTINRTATNYWDGWHWLASAIGVTSSVNVFRQHVDSIILNKSMGTLIGREYNVVTNGNAITNHYAQIWRTGFVGIHTDPARHLDVNGEVRIRDLTTDTPTRFVGADADGDLGAISWQTAADTLENYLSIAPTNIYTSDGTLSGARTVTLGSNTLTFSGTAGAPAAVNFSMTPSTNTTTFQSLDGSLNNSAMTITPTRTQIVTTNVTGGTAATFSVFADSVRISPSAVPNDDAQTRMLAINASTGRLHYVTKSTINAPSYNFAELTVSGGSTSATAATPERPDNDTPGTPSSTLVGTFTASGSTVDYTGAAGQVKVSATLSFTSSGGGDVLISIYKEGSEIASTEMREAVNAIYTTVSLPLSTTSVATNDTFEVRIEPVTGSNTITVHRQTLFVEKIY